LVRKYIEVVRESPGSFADSVKEDVAEVSSALK
jgi:hypothetical protein